MRLTLRTLLAWLDDTLPPVQVREIGKQVADSPLAQDLVQRIHRVTRQRRLTIPSRNGPDATDPNLVASYLDNDLEPEYVAEYEKKCLTSDVNLAEAASVHQILSLLGQKVQVPAEAKARMYHLVRGREARPASASNGVASEPETLTKPIPSWVVAPQPRRRLLEKFGPLAACLGLIGLLSWSAYESLKPGDDVAPSFENVSIKTAPARAPVPEESNKAEAPVEADAEPEAAAATPEHPEPPKAEATAEAGEATPPAPVPVQPTEHAAAKIPDGSVGVVAKIEGMLLRYNFDKREWERVEEGAAVHSSDRLLVLDPFRAVVATGKATFDVLGNSEILLLHKDPKEDPVVGIVHGRVVVEPSSSPTALKVVFVGRTLELEQPADSAVGLEVVNRWIYGQPTERAAVLGVYATNGEASLRMDKTREKLAGPGAILASSSGRFDPPTDAKPPAWAVEPDRTPETAELRATFLKAFSADRPVLADLVSASESQDEDVKSLAISGLRALGDLSLLTPILDRPNDPVARRAAIAAIRDEISGGGPTAQRAWDQLELDFGPEEGSKLEKLLVGFSDEEAAKSSTFRALVDDVSPRDDSLGVRELAHDNLKRLTGRNTITYDADHPEPGHAAWTRLLEAGTLKAAPK